MGKMRTGSIRERKSVFFARVLFIDEKGKRQKIERSADTQKQAQQQLMEILKELSARKEIKTTSQKVHERRGGIFARVTYINENGQRREIERRAKNRSDAKEIIKDLLRDLDDHGESLLDAAQMTFNDLSAYYEKNYLTEAEYVDGRKVAGLRSYASMKSRLAVLKTHFGRCRLRSITHGDLKRFKADRLKTKTARHTTRSITSVHRELEVMRHMFNIAARNGWIKRNPFGIGDTLISPGDEKKRERILTKDEEDRLIAACTDKRAHLRPLIICALDTGMRRGEILKLVVSDIDINERLITVQAFNTKDMRERVAAMTDRLADEVQSIIKKLPAGADTLLFGIMSDFRKSFKAACKAAGITGVRFHDLRHTNATRLVSEHMSLSEVGRVLGHTQANTTYRYVNANVETARRAAAVLNKFNQSADDSKHSMVN